MRVRHLAAGRIPDHRGVRIDQQRVTGPHRSRAFASSTRAEDPLRAFALAARARSNA